MVADVLHQAKVREFSVDGLRCRLVEGLGNLSDQALGEGAAGATELFSESGSAQNLAGFR